jgi:hypothetical protein
LGPAGKYRNLEVSDFKCEEILGLLLPDCSFASPVAASPPKSGITIGLPTLQGRQIEAFNLQFEIQTLK